MPNETTPDAAVNTSTESAADVKTETITQGKAENTTNADSGKETAVPQNTPEMANYNGFSLPKGVLEDIKKNSYHEGVRKAEKQLSEDGKIKTDDDIKNLTTFGEMMEQLGDVIGGGKKITKEQFDEFMSKKHESTSIAYEKKIEALNKQNEETMRLKEIVENDIISERLDTTLRGAAIKQGVNTDVLEDFITLMKEQKRIKFDDDRRTPIVLDEDRKAHTYDEQGNPKSIETYIGEELQRRPIFLKAATAGGAGGQYGKAEQTSKRLFEQKKSGIKVTGQSRVPTNPHSTR